MSEALSPKERVKILSGRLKNLKRGNGTFGRGGRERAIQQCEKSLANAVADRQAQR
jgi:hypothetical protein